MPKLLTVFCSSLVSVLVPMVSTSAQEFVCAAVLPCSDSGEVLEQFKGGECEAIYASQCKKFALNACESDKGSLTQELKRLSAENEALKKKLKAKTTQLKTLSVKIRK